MLSNLCHFCALLNVRHEYVLLAREHFGVAILEIRLYLANVMPWKPFRDWAGQATLEELKDQCILQLFAGHETTGRSLAHLLQTLAKHRDVWRRVCDEQDALVAKHGDAITSIFRTHPWRGPAAVHFATATM